MRADPRGARRGAYQVCMRANVCACARALSYTSAFHLAANARSVRAFRIEASSTDGSLHFCTPRRLLLVRHYEVGICRIARMISLLSLLSPSPSPFSNKQIHCRMYLCFAKGLNNAVMNLPRLDVFIRRCMICRRINLHIPLQYKAHANTISFDASTIAF